MLFCALCSSLSLLLGLLRGLLLHALLSLGLLSGLLLRFDLLNSGGSLSGRGLLGLGSLSLSGGLGGSLGRLSVVLLALLLLLLRGLLSSGGDSGGRLLGLGLAFGGLGGLLLLRGGRVLEALEGLLVGLRLGDGGGELLGLGNLQLQLSDPVVTLSSVGGLEAVLVALGGEVELVRTVGLGLGGIGLWRVSLG